MIPFELEDAIAILHRTPHILREWLTGLDDRWLHADEGPDTWSPQAVVAHLIYGEQTDWIPRMQIILGNSEDKQFLPFDREGHIPLAHHRTIESLLQQFENLRQENLMILNSFEITIDDLRRTGVHPAFGEVTLCQLLSAWVVHDLTHFAQIARVIARQYEIEIGPWAAYMGVLRK
ncbi:MAG: DinB family protein [Bacteroidota bacterium]|nr:DinB family protein [Bacteroidota bacterium]